VILNWPAVGNGKAKDAASGNLTYLDNIVSHPNKTMAPFVDVDNDGKYDPLKGDYPQIKGDQMLWWIINDGMTTNKHTESGGNPLFVEIQNCIYAYNRPNAILDDVVFHEYTIYNWGLDTIKNYRFGLFAEMNIGYANNDYVGYDSAKRFAFAYNSFNSDMEYTSGIPAAGIMFTELPGDNYPQSLEPSGSFTTFRNVVNVSDGTPLIDTEYNYILRGKKRTGEPNLHGRYQYPGTIMCDSAYSKFEDRRFVLASNDITLTPSTKQTTFRIADSKPIKIGVALLVIPYVGGCPNMNLSQINAYADTILSTYYNPPAPTAIANNDLSNTWLRVYPNPANGFLQIDVPNYLNNTITITDITGRVLETFMSNDKIKLNTSNYPSGCYIVLLKNDLGSFVAKFMKE
jgi:hypothetical protein